MGRWFANPAMKRWYAEPAHPIEPEKRMSSSDNLAVLLVGYGSLSQRAIETYNKIVSAYQQEFPKSDVSLAFTSSFIRNKLLERQGIFFHSPLTALANLQDQGNKRAVVQSLHLVAGSEFHQVASLVHGLRTFRGKFGFDYLEMGTPLLSSIDDCRRVSKALAPEFGLLNTGEQGRDRAASRELAAVVLMGHGTSHMADSAYSQMAAILENDYSNVFLGTMDGFPGIDEILGQLKRSGVRRLKLMPFFLAAGGHAQEDLAGDGSASWKSIFTKAGIQTDVHLKGLAENSEILRIFFEHTKQAAERLEKSRTARIRP
jgi:sirohydrochlorin cobaltochelatase